MAWNRDNIQFYFGNNAEFVERYCIDRTLEGIDNINDNVGYNMEITRRREICRYFAEKIPNGAHNSPGYQNNPQGYGAPFLVIGRLSGNAGRFATGERVELRHNPNGADILIGFWYNRQINNPNAQPFIGGQGICWDGWGKCIHRPNPGGDLIYREFQVGNDAELNNIFGFMDNVFQNFNNRFETPIFLERIQNFIGNRHDLPVDFLEHGVVTPKIKNWV